MSFSGPKRKLIAVVAAATLATGLRAAAQAPAATAEEAARWAAESKAVTIVRDDWGIAHVHGHSDADAVFGMIYAQAEDDFNRVERNYLTSLGRTAEADGEGSVWADLRQRLFLDPEELKGDYAASPDWLKHLMDAWADGLNFFLASHKEVHPRVILRFEPWMALSFSEGSIGGDIERVDLKELQAFYGVDRAAPRQVGGAVSNSFPVAMEEMERSAGTTEEAANEGAEREPGGSNGFAIAPSNTASHHALLLINPHTSFFFRSELQMSSDEGLDAYGAVTWGQFFVYQGFNERAGWMHTSSNVDAVDEYSEVTQNKGGAAGYQYGGAFEPYQQKTIAIAYRTGSGRAERTFTAFFSRHGPVTWEQNGRWISTRLMNLPVKALEQSFLRTKARNYAEYRKTMELMANSSNNTIFADADGEIAYWHGNFIPRRDVRFDFTKPVDGQDTATEWKGLLTLDEVPHLLNPKSGFLFNVNDSPWNGAGESSLRKADFPVYVEQGLESSRGIHAMRVLSARKDFTLDTLREAAYDRYLPWFARTVPGLVKGWEALPESDLRRAALAEPIAALRGWDFRWSADSAATTLAVFWGEAVGRPVAAKARDAGVLYEDFVAAEVSDASKLAALQTAVDQLKGQFGSWQTPWGEINRFQRLNGDIAQPFYDAGFSIPVPFPSAVWGSLASFGARPYPGTKKWYGTSGNSFVAVVEFGDKVRARAVTAGGESGHPGTKHFNDEAQRYATGDLREVYFYTEQLLGHTERSYHPGR